MYKQLQYSEPLLSVRQVGPLLSFWMLVKGRPHKRFSLRINSEACYVTSFLYIRGNRKVIQKLKETAKAIIVSVLGI